MKLNDLGIPPPRKPKKGVGCWIASAVRPIAENPINIGEVWANQYKRVGKRLVKRPEEEWILLPDGTAPALIDRQTHEKIMGNMMNNKQDSLRNNHHPEELLTAAQVAKRDKLEE